MRLHLEAGSSEEFDSVVLAAPAHAQAPMLRDLAPAIAGQVDAIPYPALAVVCLGYDRAAHGSRPGRLRFPDPVPRKA